MTRGVLLGLELLYILNIFKGGFGSPGIQGPVGPPGVGLQGLKVKIAK